MKKKLIWALPIAVLFLSPWVHHLAFENFKLAIPSMGDDGAHAWAMGLSLTALVATCFVALHENM